MATTEEPYSYSVDYPYDDPSAYQGQDVKQKKKKKDHSIMIVFLILLVIIIVSLVIGFIIFWLRWMSYP